MFDTEGWIRYIDVAHASSRGARPLGLLPEGPQSPESIQSLDWPNDCIVAAGVAEKIEKAEKGEGRLQIIRSCIYYFWWNVNYFTEISKLNRNSLMPF